MDAITRKLQGFESLEPRDSVALDSVLDDVRSYSPRHDVVRRGERRDHALVLMSGWALRYRILGDGTRQITGFLLPGDFCHLNIISRAPMDHDIAAVTMVRAAHVRRTEVDRLIEHHPRIRRAVQRSQVADESRLRASITSLGRRNALHRVGFLLCDLWMRGSAVGLPVRGRLDFPLTQADIADHLGLTPVHVNRMMQQLRREGLLELQGRRLVLPDFDRLAEAVDYDPVADAGDLPETAASGLRPPLMADADVEPRRYA